MKRTALLFRYLSTKVGWLCIALWLMGQSAPKLFPDSLVGTTATVRFKKGIWVDCLGRVEYEDLVFLEVRKGVLTFTDPHGGFTDQNGEAIAHPNPRRCAARYIRQEISNGHPVYFVSLKHLSAVLVGNKIVWGDGKP